MNERELVAQLQKLNAIKPQENFAQVSRATILASERRDPFQMSIGKSFWTQSLTFGLSIGLVALFFVVALSNVITRLHPLAQPNLAGVGSDALASEAKDVLNNMDISLNEAAYFDASMQQSSVALHEAGVNGPSHANPVLLENELKTLAPQENGAKTIDDLLNQAL